jgi:hypothetical protein
MSPGLKEINFESQALQRSPGLKRNKQHETLAEG